MAVDHILYHARHTANDTTLPMKVIAGTVNIRSGYGNAKLRSVRGMFAVNSGGNPAGFTTIDVKNSNWVRGVEITASRLDQATAFGDETYGFLPGHDAPLKANSSFNIMSSVSSWTPGTDGYKDVYCLVEIDYDAVPSFNVDSQKGYPLSMKETATVTTTDNTLVRFASVDNLDPGVEYLLSEVRLDKISVGYGAIGAVFVVISGIQTMRGLIMIIPVKAFGQDLVPQIKDSVKWTKQSYNVDVITQFGASLTMTIHQEFIASNNSV